MNTPTDTSMPDDQLPPDPDVYTPAPSAATRPIHLRWRYLSLVALGGAIGTAVREIVAEMFPAVDGVSWSIFWINIVGALLLGLLLEALSHRGPDYGHRRTLRLLLGTGVLGGFTTYSALAEATAALFLDGHGLAGTGYALLTVVSGAIATAGGLVAASWMRPRTVHA